jgi:NADPH-dependent 2,4-dienoyl-CoA reductase/sulfur reductase-like enzyme
MTDQETIESCEVPGFPNCYLIGSFDDRITFYSQQVRALNLIDALLRTAHLERFRQVAVIGGGAAGMTAAAGLALTLDAQVELFERERNPVFLQRACTRRSLHPHLFDWPEAGALEEEARLPILDWRAGIAANAAQMVEQAFRDVGNACPNLRLLDRCRVVAIERRDDTYEVQFGLQSMPPMSNCLPTHPTGVHFSRGSPRNRCTRAL